LIYGQGYPPRLVPDNRFSATPRLLNSIAPSRRPAVPPAVAPGGALEERAQRRQRVDQLLLRDAAVVEIDTPECPDRRHIGALTSDGLTDNRPLWHLIAKYVTADFLAEIAWEYEKGRFLLIGTTHIDARCPVIWNMGAIASRAICTTKPTVRFTGTNGGVRGRIVSEQLLRRVSFVRGWS